MAPEGEAAVSGRLGAVQHTALAEGPVVVDSGGFAIYSSAQTYSYLNVHDGVTRFIRNVVA